MLSWFIFILQDHFQLMIEARGPTAGPCFVGSLVDKMVKYGLDILTITRNKRSHFQCVFNRNSMSSKDCVLDSEINYLGNSYVEVLLNLIVKFTFIKKAVVNSIEDRKSSLNILIR